MSQHRAGSSRGFLRELDFNRSALPVSASCEEFSSKSGVSTTASSVVVSCGGSGLPLPSRVRNELRHKREKEEALHQLPGRALTFFELQQELNNLLCGDISSVEDYDSGRHPSPDALRQQFQHLIDHVDGDTRRLLEPVFLGWQRSDRIPTSARIMDVLRFKRLILRQGMETPFQDLLDWLLLASRLHETVTMEKVLHFARQLGPQSRHAVDEVMRRAAPPSSAMTVLRAVDVYVTLRSQVQPTLVDHSCISGRYYAMALDEFIERDEREPRVDVFHEVQREINQSMRGLLCEWMLEFTLRYNRLTLRSETYFLGVALLDRFLAVRAIKRESFLLYGCAALLLASKYEEIHAIPVVDLTECARRNFTTRQLMEAEREIAATLSFRITTTTLSNIAGTLLVDQDPPAQESQAHLLHYMLATLSIHTYLEQYPQSILAATALFISRVVCGVPTGEPSDAVRSLFPVVLRALHKNTQGAKLGGLVWKLFSSERFGCVSATPFLQQFESAMKLSSEDEYASSRNL